ncbi:hypothetical protein RHSIM_Rhsim12G0142100 [Rhododendron simsii]|uniref:Retrotransposon Copia-like N-terminal domain-containing protein n=1 Tax=Rhododendron simsii TaxID=118357 RepID=A0A834G5S9_RHOSS|nr:hypothetical protein RHSIM_Rhsim12G0142100 [Rhododendron simsii]
MSYLPNSLSFLIANFQSFVTIKLENSNYFAWKTQIENALKATDLFGYVDGSIEIPASKITDSSGHQTLNVAFTQWNTIDRMLLSCLIATLTPSILPHVVGSEHTFQLLNKLEEKFSVLSRSHIHDLRRRLYSLNKTGSMDSYIDSIKEIVQKLAASGSQIDDEELIFHTLNGLKKGYKSFKQMIRTRTEHLSFGSFSSMLLAEELHVSQDQVDSSTILVAPHQTSNPNASASSSSGPSSLFGSHSAPPPFQFPFPTSPSQNYFPSAQRHYNGPRFNRNTNRFRGNQFSKPFNSHFSSNSGWPSSASPGFQSPSGWNSSLGSGFQGSYGSQGSVFQGSYGPPGASGFPFSSGYGGLSNASCQICHRNNHQASTCYYRSNLGYRPFGQNGRPSFGPPVPPTGPSTGPSSSQAFYAASDPMGYYDTGTSFDHPAYAFNMTGYGNCSPSPSQLNGSVTSNEAHSSGHGTTTSTPNDFESAPPTSQSPAGS